MGQGKYDQVGGSTETNRQNSAFFDPTGNYANAMEGFKGMYSDAAGNFDPNKAFQAFMGQVPEMTRMASLGGGEIGQMYRNIAAANTRLGMEQMPAWLKSSGAGAATVGDVISRNANEASAATQQYMGQNFLQPMLGQGFDAQNRMMQMGISGFGDMASKQGEFYMPSYERRKSGWDYMMDLGGLGVSALSAFK